MALQILRDCQTQSELYSADFTRDSNNNDSDLVILCWLFHRMWHTFSQNLSILRRIKSSDAQQGLGVLTDSATVKDYLDYYQSI